MARDLLGQPLHPGSLGKVPIPCPPPAPRSCSGHQVLSGGREDTRPTPVHPMSEEAGLSSSPGAASFLSRPDLRSHGMGDTGRGEQWARRVSRGSPCLSCSHAEARYRAFVTDGLALGQRGPSNRSLSGRRDPSGTAQLSSEWGVAARSRLVVVSPPSFHLQLPGDAVQAAARKRTAV